jgi:serine/threonine protein kinase
MRMLYLAEDKNLGRQVAFKFLLGALSQVVHPNIVEIHSMDEIDSHLVIDIEYVKGQPLSQIIQHHPVS